jgi:hypothetical protein
VQPINPGWSFGNIIVSEENSSAPDTEREVVSRDSYGRQIGKLLDAVCELIKAGGYANEIPAYREVRELRDRVEQTKRNAAVRRVDQLRRDLQYLEAVDRDVFLQKVEALRAMLAEAVHTRPR